MKTAFLFILATVVLLRVSIWSLPMQRDAIGYAYMGKEIAAGAVLYKQIWDHKPPAVYMLDALINRIFSDSYIPALLITSLVIACIASVLLFILLRRYFSPQVSLVTTLLFSIFANVYVLTVGDNLIEGYMVPLLIGFYLIFVHAIGHKSRILFVFSGIILGVLFLFKQIGILPGAACVFYLFWQKRLSSWKDIKFIALGFIASLFPVVAYFWMHDALKEMIDAVFIYNIYYSKQGDLFSLGQSAYYSIEVIIATLIFWTLAVIGFFKKKKFKIDALFIFFFLTSFLGVAMGGKYAFTRHYFLLVYPALAYFVAKAIEKLSMLLKKDRFLKISSMFIIVALFLPSFVLQVQSVLAGFYFQNKLPFSDDEIQYIIGLQNYNFVKEEKTYYQIADYLRHKVKSGNIVLDWGAEPEIYMFSHTRTPSRYYYNFPLNGIFVKFDPTRISRRKVFMEELVNNVPEYIITNDQKTKHQPNFQELDFPAFKEFLRDNYVIETEIDNFILWKRKIPLA